ncbi:DUF1211 domain-containing protein [Clostridium sp. YIM B02505]|uniref:DUF1211 domain-containing protein n=1 Tax=Clostridium yunnanense TaxID=2800325 RepID=A0ABS1ENR0_9CLOT|nr:TMEM175 family protein [Clostridium yunnanense]MBK1810913.1 DUF1211 domain-containing protein [Clostridium yunnanense]
MKISKNRLEAFSDGVIAIIVTIIVLNIPTPNTFDAASIYSLINSIVVYLVSFLVVGNFWNQHRRLFDELEHVTNRVVWINIIFLFFLSLVPLFTKWVIQNPNAVAPAVGYAIVFLCVNFSMTFMFLLIIPTTLFEHKYKLYSRIFIMPVISSIIILIAFYYPRISIILFIGLPVASSVLNLLFEVDPQHHERQKRRRPHFHDKH